MTHRNNNNADGAGPRTQRDSGEYHVADALRDSVETAETLATADMLLTAPAWDDTERAGRISLWRDALYRGELRQLSTLRKGDKFICASGREWQIIGWYKDRVGECPLVRSLTNAEEKTIFAGCASGLVLP